MGYLFYHGSQIDFEFACEGIDRRALKPKSAKVSIFDDDGQVILQDQIATVKEHIVSYQLDPKVVKAGEDYVAVFELLFAPGATPKHTIMFSIASRGTPKSAKGTPVGKLDISSSDDEIEDAVRKTLRQNRRRGQDNKQNVKATYSTAQGKVGKRIGR